MRASTGRRKAAAARRSRRSCPRRERPRRRAPRWRAPANTERRTRTNPDSVTRPRRRRVRDGQATMPTTSTVAVPADQRAAAPHCVRRRRRAGRRRRGSRNPNNRPACAPYAGIAARDTRANANGIADGSEARPLECAAAPIGLRASLIPNHEADHGRRRKDEEDAHRQGQRRLVQEFHDPAPLIQRRQDRRERREHRPAFAVGDPRQADVQQQQI